MYYADIDAAILDRIQQGDTQFSAIWSKLTSVVGNRYLGSGGVFRLVDRRLQALRKRGKIGFKNGHWKLLHR